MPVNGAWRYCTLVDCYTWCSHKAGKFAAKKRGTRYLCIVDVLTMNSADYQQDCEGAKLVLSLLLSRFTLFIACGHCGLLLI
jgi:hypothetical protein